MHHAPDNPQNTKLTESYLRAINQFAIDILEITNIDELVWHIASEVVGNLDFIDCVVYLYESERDMLVQVAAIGEKSPQKHVILNRLEIPVGSGITGHVAKTRQPILLDNTRRDERYLQDLTEFASEICVPMIYQDQLIGVIDSEHHEPNYFNEFHLELLTTIAAMASSKINQIRIQNDLQTQASIIEQVSEAVLLVNKDGFISQCNLAAESLFGVNREDFIASDVRHLIPEDYDPEQLFNDINNSVKESGVWQGRIKIHQGSYRDLITSVSVTLLPATDNMAQRYICVTRDISEQINKERLERELHQAQKMESLGHLTGGIAHDFNNLLGIISGYSDLARFQTDSLDNEKLSNYIDQIQDAARRATNLVSQMLSFSRDTPVEDKPTQLSETIQSDMRMLRAILPSSIELCIDTEKDLPMVLIDSTRVHQLLMNLSVNARDAMGGSGLLNITLRMVRNLHTESPVSHRPVKGDWVELSVSDTGTGIAVEDIKKIFNPFYTTKEVGSGTGMGLSVVYKIMDEYQGHIFVDSEIGVGTTFRLLFKPYSEGSEDIPRMAEHPQTQIPPGDGSHILVVDDERALALLIARILEEHGYQVTASSDSREAFRIIETDPQRFDLVVTDQTMPGMTGTDLISAIRQISPELPVILCTGYSDKVDSNIARKLNIPYFDKPIDSAKLLATIRMILDKHTP